MVIHKANPAEELFSHDVMQGKLLIRVHGPITELNCDSFSEKFMEEVKAYQAKGILAVVVDLTEIEHLPSVGFYPIRNLVSHHPELKIAIVASPGTPNRQAIHMLYRVKKNFVVCDSVKEALQ